MAVRSGAGTGPEAVADRAWRIPLRGVNAYALLTQEGTVLIDAGNRGDGRRILEALRAAGIEAPRHILLTHADMDHAGGVRAIVEATSATVHASPEQAELLAGHGRPSALRRFGRLLTGRLACVPDLADGARVAGLLVLATPGHTAGHVALLREADGVLFAGDALAVRREEVRLLGAALTEDFAKATASLRRLVELRPSVVLPGHGNPLSPQGALEAALRRRSGKR